MTLFFQRAFPSSWQPKGLTDYETFYAPVAHNLLVGQGYQRGAGSPATDYPPGYPFILASVFWLSQQLGTGQEIALEIFAALAMGFAALLLYGLARRVWPSPAALVTPLLWMSYPFALWLTKGANPEMPFFIALFGACYLFWRAALGHSLRWGPHFLCGLLLGLAMLIRPIAIGLGFVFGGLLLLTRRDLHLRARGLLVGVLLAGDLIVALPWEIWLYYRTSRVELLSTNGLMSMKDGLTFAVELKDFRESVRVPADVDALMQNLAAHSGEMKSVGDLVSVFGRELQSRPRAAAELIALKVARSWYGTNSGRHERTVLFFQAGYLLLFLWASYAAWKRGGTARELAAGVWVLVLYFWATTILVLSILRYMVPAMGLAFVLIPALAPSRQTAEQHREPQALGTLRPQMGRAIEAQANRE